MPTTTGMRQVHVGWDPFPTRPSPPVGSIVDVQVSVDGTAILILTEFEYPSGLSQTQEPASPTACTQEEYTTEWYRCRYNNARRTLYGKVEVKAVAFPSDPILSLDGDVWPNNWPNIDDPPSTGTSERPRFSADGTRENPRTYFVRFRAATCEDNRQSGRRYCATATTIRVHYWYD